MRARGSTSAHIYLVTTILISTEAGTRSPSMGQSGIRPDWRLAGFRIATDAGPGSSPGAGRGLTTRRGDSLPSITGAGCRLDRGGDGCPGRLQLRLSMGLHS